MMRIFDEHAKIRQQALRTRLGVNAVIDSINVTLTQLHPTPANVKHRRWDAIGERVELLQAGNFRFVGRRSEDPQAVRYLTIQPQCKATIDILNGSTPDSASSSDPIAESAFMHQIHVVQIRSRNKSAKHEMVWCRRELKAPPGTDRDDRSSIVPLHRWRCGPKSNSTASARRRNFQLLAQRLDREHPATRGHESTSRQALVIISHHADVAVFFREGTDDEILRAVGILVFVDEDVLEAILILLFDVRRLAKQSHDLQQQVVKIQGVLLPQRALVSVKDARYDLLIPAVGPFRVGEVVDAFVFGPIDQGEDDGRREAALVQPQVFQALADHSPLVVLVEDQEVPAHAYAVAVPAEDPAADVVEGADPGPPRHRRPDQSVDALPHLVGRF